MAEMREPRGQSVAYAVGVGRGSRQPSSAASTCTIPASVGRGTAMYASGASNKYSQEMRNAQMPYEEYLANSQTLQNYIPGLHRPGENYPTLPEPRPSGARPKMIPEQLIRDYTSGAKNEISAVFEYCSMVKAKVEFREVAVADIPNNHFAFACECKIAGKPYPQGVGNTKKKAKTAAARAAMDIILKHGLILSDDEEYGDVSEAAAASGTSQSADKYDLGNKNEVMMLHELCAKKGIKLEPVLSDRMTADGLFYCQFYGDGQLLGSDSALNKKEAKTKAAADALKNLLFADSQVTDVVHHWDAMAALVRERVVWVMNNVPPSVRGWNVLAAFILKRHPEDQGTVVSVGTGDGCVVSKSLSPDPNGRVVMDCHAEVIARKALMKWFYKQIHLLYSNEPVSLPSVFEYNPETCKLCFKQTVSIHMYISTAPCGDASAFPIDNAPILREDEAETMNKGIHMPTFDIPAHGKLRVKSEIGCTSRPVDRLQDQATLRNLRNGVQCIRTMSCSDKLMRWNVLGLQGCLLSQYLEPVYLSSVTIGDNFDLGHVTRALCCRVTESLTRELPDGYSLRHPFIGRVSVYEPATKPGNPSRNISINWSADDKVPEVLDANEGKSIDESPFKTGRSGHFHASRLSKAGFDFRYQKLARETGNLHLVEKFNTYADRKLAATDYYKARDRLFDYLKNAHYGEWLARPDELEHFSTECR